MTTCNLSSLISPAFYESHRAVKNNEINELVEKGGRGSAKPEIALGWKFNMPRDTEAQLAKIRKKYMPEAVEDGE